MHMITKFLGDGPVWSSMNGLQGAIVQFSEWPVGEDWEHTKEWMQLIMGTLERHANAHAEALKANPSVKEGGK